MTQLMRQRKAPSIDWIVRVDDYSRAFARYFEIQAKSINSSKWYLMNLQVSMLLNKSSDVDWWR